MLGLLLAAQLAGWQTPVLVVGHRNPDTDAILSALALTSLLRAQGVQAQAIAQGTPNPETAYVLQRCGLRAPPIQTTVAATQAVMLVDHSDLALAPEGLTPRNLVGIVDHHKLGGLQSDAPLLARIEPVGSTATVLTSMFAADKAPITPSMACGLLAAILSDTRGFTSPTTTALDRQSGAHLAALAGIPDPAAMGRRMLEVYASAMAKVGDTTLINTDYKRFAIGALSVGVAQVEAPDIGFVIARSPGLLEAMERQRRQQGLHTLLLLATDIPRQGSELLVTSADPERIASLFGVQLNQGRAWVPGLMSRKRQVVPLLQEGLR
jgi:manganese-dependent inorganic pyrophosphatase